MTDFCKRLLVIAVGALAFAGASYGQNITSCANGSPAVNPGALNLRAEGTAELVGDVQFSCSNSGAPTSTGSLTAFLSAPVTSKLLTTDTAATPAYTEATLFLCSSAANCATNPPTSTSTAQGTISGQQILFSSVAFPAGTFWARISDVRVNANAVTISATLTTVTEQVLATANGTSASTLPTTVGFVFKSLAPLTLLPAPNGPFSATVTLYTTCAGNPLPFVNNLSTYSFVAELAETFGGAFKVGTGPSPSGEGGSYLGPGGAGTASFGTRVQLVFANVSSGMTIYVPTSITAGPLTLQLVSSATAAEPTAFPVVSASTTTGAPTTGGFGSTGETYSASAAYTPSSGAVTVVYEVTSTNPAVIESALLPVWISFAPNAFTTAQGPITLQESYAPTAAAAAATTIPNFAPVTGSTNVTTVATCATNLLFPYVTSALGFDTGIAIANTSTDPFGTAPTPGTCMLNYYGTGAPSPSTGIASPGGTIASGTVATFLSSGLAPGFSGYVIAQCNFQYGYGYAFIEDGLGTSSGVAEGYIAVNLQRPVANAIIGQ